jgi:hypothetical protein
MQTIGLSNVVEAFAERLLDVMLQRSVISVNLRNDGQLKSGHNVPVSPRWFTGFVNGHTSGSCLTPPSVAEAKSEVVRPPAATQTTWRECQVR